MNQQLPNYKNPIPLSIAVTLQEILNFNLMPFSFQGFKFDSLKWLHKELES